MAARGIPCHHRRRRYCHRGSLSFDGWLSRLSTLPPPLNVQPRPIEAPSPLVCWRFSSRLPLVRRLVVASTSASASHHLLSRSRRTRLSSTPPLCSRQLVVASHLFAPPPPLDAPPPQDWLCRRRRQCAGVVAVDAQASSPLLRL